MIIFKTIRYKNFLSTGNSFIEITLNKNPITLSVGKNGSGKSTILDAICFVLFGKPFRNINKPLIINSVNEKECIVELEFSTNNKNYKIIRGLKPNIFEIYCDDILLNQDSATKDYQKHLETYILGMNFKSFTQIVILGAASFIPFMQLSPADRRTIIEDLLDIQIFSTMSVISKQRIQTIKENIDKNRTEYTGKIDKKNFISQTIHSLESKNENKIDLLKSKINETEEILKNINKEIEQIKEEEKSFHQKIIKLPSLKKKQEKLLSFRGKIELNHKKELKQFDFFNNNDVCPTCLQNIQKTFKDSYISAGKEKISTFENGIKEIKKEIEACIEQIDEIETNIKKMNHLKNILIGKETQKISFISILNNLKEEIEQIEKADDVLNSSKKELMSVENDIIQLEKDKEALLDELQYATIALNILKDGGIKTKIIKQYIPIINKIINKYLTEMNFFVNFHINENFNEIIKSRFCDEFSYENFSEGEKMKIDMALMLAWRAIAKMKNSANTNLLILDEIFDSSLDSDSTDSLMSILQSLSENTNIFVISHRGDILADKIPHILKFEKIKNFSELTIQEK